MAEEIVKYLIRDVAKMSGRAGTLRQSVDRNCSDRLDCRWNGFERTIYTEANRAVKKDRREVEFPVEYGLNLQSEHEHG